jgi:hypothetical protein
MGYTLKASKDDLYKKGFHYSRAISDKDSEYYSLRFPVHKYKQQTTLECEITVELQTGNVSIDVFNVGTRDIYVPYYNDQFVGDNLVLTSIQKTIDKQMKKLGIKKKRK